MGKQARLERGGSQVCASEVENWLGDTKEFPEKLTKMRKYSLCLLLVRATIVVSGIPSLCNEYTVLPEKIKSMTTGV